MWGLGPGDTWRQRVVVSRKRKRWELVRVKGLGFLRAGMWGLRFGVKG